MITSKLFKSSLCILPIGTPKRKDASVKIDLLIDQTRSIRIRDKYEPISETLPSKDVALIIFSQGRPRDWLCSECSDQKVEMLTKFGAQETASGLKDLTQRVNSHVHDVSYKSMIPISRFERKR